MINRLFIFRNLFKGNIKTNTNVDRLILSNKSFRDLFKYLIKIKQLKYLQIRLILNYIINKYMYFEFFK